MQTRSSLRASVIVAGLLLLSLFSFVACTRSKLGPVPTLETTPQQAQVAETKTPGTTIVAADATATPTGGITATVIIPTMTPTVAGGGVAPTATPAAGAQPTATPATAPTATPAPAAGQGFEYIVKTGDTLWGIAIRFGTTIEAIKTKNKLTSNTIYKGDKLIIPGVAGGGETVTHVVQPGENLFRISLKYNTTVEAIASANNIINPGFVRAGQKLVIVQGAAAPGGSVRYHVVQPGENLSSIALKYNTTPWKIAAANGISNINLIYAGRTLRIP